MDSHSLSLTSVKGLTNQLFECTDHPLHYLKLSPPQQHTEVGTFFRNILESLPIQNPRGS